MAWPLGAKIRVQPLVNHHGSALFALQTPEGGVNDSHTINYIRKMPQKEQGFDGANRLVYCPRNRLDLFRPSTKSARAGGASERNGRKVD